MSRPKLLGLFCGEGGADYGYMLAGFDVTGVDLYPQKRYPRHEHMRFVQADAIEYVLAHGHEYAAITASPPCQTHSQITPDKAKHLDLIPQTRYALESLGLPYIIENVSGAKKALRNPVMLCGADFGLKVYRHRLFEANFMLLVPPHVPHRDNTPRAGHAMSSAGFVSITSGGSGINEAQLASLNKAAEQADRYAKQYGHTQAYVSAKGFISVSGHFSASEYVKFAMGIDWMSNKGLAQAIPPAYTHFLGKQLMQHVLHRREQPASEHEDIFASVR